MTKEQAEIEFILTQKNSLQKEVWFKILQYAGIAFAFWFITRPDSIINRSKTVEDIAIQRINITTELLKYKSPQQLEFAYQVVKETYESKGEPMIPALDSITRNRIRRLQELKNLKKDKEILIKRRSKPDVDKQMIDGMILVVDNKIYDLEEE